MDKFKHRKTSAFQVFHDPQEDKTILILDEGLVSILGGVILDSETDNAALRALGYRLDGDSPPPPRKRPYDRAYDRGYRRNNNYDRRETPDDEYYDDYGD